MVLRSLSSGHRLQRTPRDLEDRHIAFMFIVMLNTFHQPLLHLLSRMNPRQNADTYMHKTRQEPPKLRLKTHLIYMPAHSARACKACVSGTTLKLLPLFKPCAGAAVTVGLLASSHLRNTLLRSRGMPSSTTVEKGTNGRSSIPEARIA